MPTKLFLGMPKKGELESHLIRSHLWKNENLTGTKQLDETLFQKQSFIGKWLDPKMRSLKEINELESEIRAVLQSYCPELHFSNEELVLFPQLVVE